MSLIKNLACNSSTDYSGSVTNSLPHDATTGIKGEIKVAAGGARGEAFLPSLVSSLARRLSALSSFSRRKYIEVVRLG